MPRTTQPRRRAKAKAFPLGARVVIFHVRDLAPVEELVDALHPKPRRKRSGGGDKRGRPTARARGGEHPLMFLTDDDHLIGVTPLSRALAKTARRTIEGTLGDAVQYVQTQFIKAPKPAGGTGTRPRGQR